MQKRGQIQQGNVIVLTVTRALKIDVEKAKKDEETYDTYLRGHLELEPIEEIELQELPKRTAKKLILDYVKTHHGAPTSEIIENMRLVPWQVADILSELKKEGRIYKLDQPPT
jgi:hypothetical protein